jgi:uncharacterized protein (DUF1684 family)
MSPSRSRHPLAGRECASPRSTSTWPAGRAGRFILPMLLLLAGGCAPKVDPEYVQEIDAWHADRVADLESPTGWLTLVGRHELHPGANTLGSAEGLDVRLVASAPPRVGTLTLAPDGIIFAPEPGVRIFVGGNPDSVLAAPIVVNTDASDDPTILGTDTLSFYVIERGDQRFLRVKDSNSEVRRDFKGIDRFPVDPRWRVTARLERFDPPRTIAITNALGQVTESPTPGRLVLDLRGRHCTLIPTGEPEEELFIVFADETSGKSTYGAGRFLSTDPPGADGTVVLDFNKAVNPPCVFTPYATCPLPPDENRLPLAVQAGEKMWNQGHPAGH